MAEGKAGKNPKVKEKDFVEKAKDWLGGLTKGNPYSGSAASERMKRNLNPDDAASGVPATPEPQSRNQYMHERNAGDPVALSMSFDQWKKLG